MVLPSTPNPSVSRAEGYRGRGGSRSFLFGITSFSRPQELLYPVMLALHVNPDSLSERLVKGTNTVMTYGGFVQFNWRDELTNISCSGSTGAFMSPEGGLMGSVDAGALNRAGRTSNGRRNSMAWERQEDLQDLFRSNGHAFGDRGQPIIRARVACLYDRGLYLGHFKSMEIDESADSPYTFSLGWDFAVEQVIYKIPGAVGSSGDISSVLSGAETSGGVA